MTSPQKQFNVAIFNQFRLIYNNNIVYERNNKDYIVYLLYFYIKCVIVDYSYMVITTYNVEMLSHKVV